MDALYKSTFTYLLTYCRKRDVLSRCALVLQVRLHINGRRRIRGKGSSLLFGGFTLMIVAFILVHIKLPLRLKVCVKVASGETFVR